MKVALARLDFKNILLIITLLFITFSASAVQAATTKSSATLNNEGIKSGNVVNIHGGSAFYSSFNESRSVEWLTGSIKQSIVLVPDPERFVNIDQPGKGISKTVALKPSTYYAHAFASKQIYASVVITGTD